MVRNTISDKLSEFAGAGTNPAAAYVETAGGVHSPSPSGSSIAHLLRPFRLPTILIGDSQLGGISTTKSAYESLLLAGYDVEALLLFSDADRGLGNAEYLARWGEEIGLKVWGLAGPSSNGGASWGSPPPREGTPAEDVARMRKFYAGLVAGRGEAASTDEAATGLVGVVEHLRQRHRERVEDLSTMAARTRQHCWWPFTQHLQAKTDADVNVIDSAHGDFFHVYRDSDAAKPDSQHTSRDNEPHESLLQPLLDGSASWWTQCLGHADAGLTYAAARAAGRYGHVLFPMCANEPSLNLSETLLGKQVRPQSIGAAPGKGWASRVFFSDDGSTGMEVAIKMALTSASQRYAPRAKTTATKDRVAHGRSAGYQGGRPPREWKILGLQGSYHGDTIGAMDASEPSIFNERIEWYRGRGDWFAPPSVGIRNGEVNIDLPLKDASWLSLANNHSATRTYASLADVYDVKARLKSDSLAQVYRDLIFGWLEHLTRIEQQRYGALILEPLVMGAGGMIFVDPLFQRCFVDVVRANTDLFALSDPPLRRPAHIQHPLVTQGEDNAWQGLPIIFDEVFTGLYRLGYPTPSDALDVRPDISVLAKILTGGMVPMSVTLASASIFDTFAQSDNKADALLHGHSYTAHPIGCEIARETLRRLEKMRCGGQWSAEAADWSAGDIIAAKSSAVDPAGSTSQASESMVKPWSFWSKDAVDQLSHKESVDSVMALGTVLAVNLRDVSGGGGECQCDWSAIVHNCTSPTLLT